MLSKVYQLTSEDDIRHKNYTLVMSQPDSPLAGYVNEHISVYIDTVLSGCNGSIMDDEAIVLSVLNNEEISSEQKDRYTNALQTSVTSLSEIENESLWSTLLDKDIVICSEENIVSYFAGIDRLDDSLIEFINRSDAELNFANIHIEDEQKDKLFIAIIICNDLSNDKYEQSVCSLNYIYKTSFNVINIVEDKFKILVDNDIIHMNLEPLRFIRQNYPEQLFYYIKKNIKAYVDIMTEEHFILDEAMSILSWKVDDEIKIALLEFIKTPLAIVDKGYVPAVNDHILRNNFEPSELLNLTSSYKTWDASTQFLILLRAIQSISRLIANPHEVSKSLLKRLFSTENLGKDKKVALLIALLPSKDFSKEARKEYLDLLGLTEFSKIGGRGKPKIEVDATNQLLLTAFKDNGLLSSFEEDDDKPGYYKIIR